MSSLKTQAEGLRKSLIRRGLDSRDVDIAMNVFIGIAALDQALFPNNGVGIRICIAQCRHKFHAHYGQPIKGVQKEHYAIFMHGLHDRWEEDSSLFFIREKGNRAIVLPKRMHRKITREEFAALIAVHEVRHRLQFQLGRRLKKFNAWTWKKARHPLLHRIGKFVYHYMVLERECRLRDGFKKKFVRRRTNSEEFDSKVIECLVLHRLGSIQSQAELLKLVMAEPTSTL